MTKTLLLIIIFIWGIPSTYIRSKFRKIVYKTDDWKINIKPVFIKELTGLLRLLLEAGADKEAKNSQGKTAYDLALENDFELLIEICKQ